MHARASREAETPATTCGATEETNDKEPDYYDNEPNLDATPKDVDNLSTPWAADSVPPTDMLNHIDNTPRRLLKTSGRYVI